MPQRTQNFLIHILLLWTTIFSIIQIVIIILFFTAGHKGLSQDSSAVEPSKMPIVGTVASSPGFLKAKMLSFTATKAKNQSQINWTARCPDDALISDTELTVKVDGYYFLNLQVSLSECKLSNNYTVSLNKRDRENQEEKVLLEGSINKETCSTGILSKAEELGAGVRLVVIINAPVEIVDETESKTHLDIIFMERS